MAGLHGAHSSPMSWDRDTLSTLPLTANVDGGGRVFRRSHELSEDGMAGVLLSACQTLQ